MSVAPEQLGRLFAQPLQEADLADPVVVGRLLEDGDSADLRWLLARTGEPTVRAILVRWGERLVSRRSRAFWSTVLDVPPSTPPRAAELWPLA